MTTQPNEDLSTHLRRIVRRSRDTLESFLHVEAVSGIVLLCAAAAAFIWANSPAADSYHRVWSASATVGVGAFSLTQTLHFIVNDVLMTVFFLVVGMEIRREMHAGALSGVRTASLPAIAAAGGVVVPALIYLGINSAPEVRAGWAIPTATDIAFAVGALALLGRGVPSAVRVMLLAIAIVDDIAAVLIIALFYSDGLQYSGLLVAAFAVLLVLGLQRAGVTAAYVYIAPGALLWFGLLKAGAHPTLAGVLLGLMTPASTSGTSRRSPAASVEEALHPWVAFGVMPVFALANAGIDLSAVDVTGAAPTGLIAGIAAALVIGKPVGIVLASWLAVRFAGCQLPVGMTWRHFWLIGCFGGIGFTMAIFIATLAFEEGALLAAAKVGVLIASVAASTIGLVIGRRCLAPRTA